MSGCAIGISAALERVRWGPWDDVVTMAPRSYARSVQAAGAIALLLPPGVPAEADLDSVLDRLDALLLSGGADVDPGTYGEAPHPETRDTWPERDRFEIGLARRALTRGLPILGVCRGMQILNIALGGTLVQHLPDTLASDRHRDTPGSFGAHEVRLAPGSLVARAVGHDRTEVRSHHHQGLDRLGEGLVATGWSVADDLVEAVELPDAGFVLGVLWHPEEDAQSHVVRALVEAADTEAAAQPRAASGRR